MCLSVYLRETPGCEVIGLKRNGQTGAALLEISGLSTKGELTWERSAKSTKTPCADIPSKASEPLSRRIIAVLSENKRTIGAIVLGVLAVVLLGTTQIGHAILVLLALYVLKAKADLISKIFNECVRKICHFCMNFVAKKVKGNGKGDPHRLQSKENDEPGKKRINKKTDPATQALCVRLTGKREGKNEFPNQ